jgi:hypothetical protein
MMKKCLSAAQINRINERSLAMMHKDGNEMKRDTRSK